jgi:hypothetical protein
MPRKTDAAKQAALAANLKAMFQTLAGRPVPSTIRSVLDQLDEGEREVLARRKRS